MKTTMKIFLALVTLSMVLFTSCIEEPENNEPPTITINSPSSDTTHVFIGDSIVFDITISSETNLVDLKALASVVGVDFVNHTFDFTETNTTSKNVEVVAHITEQVADGTEIQITFTVQNENSSAFDTKIIVAQKKETPLSEAKDFEWKRVAGNPAVGLEYFGLTWTSNSETTAIIRKDATKFVELNEVLWTTLTSIEELAEAIDASEDMERWEKISVTDVNKEYNLVLGTIKDEKYFLINVTNSTVSVAAAGTTVIVTGEYKE